MATLEERLDPNSPHYDAELAKMRGKAYSAHAAHVQDMKTDPVYRDAVVKKFGKDYDIK